VELYCALGVDGKKHTAEICEALGCSRQTLSNIKKRIYDAFGGMWPMAA
jgi:DNA-binding CsgD family transcriptional regulator